MSGEYHIPKTQNYYVQWFSLKYFLYSLLMDKKCGSGKRN